MKKHGGMSVALAASCKPAVTESVASHDLAANRNPNSLRGDDSSGDDAEKSDVRSLVGKGFCHLFNCPTDEQVFRYGGKLIDHTPEVQEPLRTALMKLAYALESPQAHSGLTSYDDPNEAGSDENFNMPAGYTYLLQFVAHDLVQSVSSLAVAGHGRIALNNGRTAPLRLEAIYNDGPQNSPLLYEPDPADRTAPGPSLRLGPLDTRQPCPFRDLARVDLMKAITDVSRQVAQKEPSNESSSMRLRDVLVGDARNDDNAILSQLTVVFHLLHNGLVRWTEENVAPEAHVDGGDKPEIVIDRFYFARMASTLIFRNILRRDLMERLLHPGVLCLYKSATPPKIFKFKGKMPLEFTHGALRVCHVMLREGYRLNQQSPIFDLKAVLTRNSANYDSVSMPMPESWAVAWSHFFNIGSASTGQLNLSLRLRPRYQNQTQARELFEHVDGTTKPGLAYRDMLSAALAGLWSASAMIDKLAQSPDPALAAVFNQATLADASFRTKVIREWLEKTFLDDSLNSYKFDDAELDALSQDPPLPLFLMFEAMKDKDSNGTRLGPLGSIIVAAVIFGILDSDPLTPCSKAPLKEQLDYLHDNVFRAAVPKLAFPELESMPDLIRFVAKLNGLTDATPPFI
jgi:hypothetical protein